MMTGDPDRGERILPSDTAAGRLAVVLLSGGLDSATCLAIASDAGYECVALSFNYGQRHEAELSCAADVAAAAGVEDVVIDIDLTTFGDSALTGGFAVPKRDSLDESASREPASGDARTARRLPPKIDSLPISTQAPSAGLGTPPPMGKRGQRPRAGGAAPEAVGGSNIPVTYVPARNTIFLSFALAFAEVRGAFDIFIGVNAVDYSGYPDCRPEYVAAFEEMANLATRAAVEGQDRLTIHTPLIHMSKGEIIRRGVTLGVDYSLTSSCYDPPADRVACGRCDACLLRLKGFKEAGIPDPIDYAISDPGRSDPASESERRSPSSRRGGGSP